MAQSELSMNVLVRHAVYETNSSSCHSLAVLKDDNHQKNVQTAELCQVKLDNEQKSYVQLILPNTLYRRQMAFRTTEEKLAYILSVEKNEAKLVQVLKQFFDLHMVDSLVLKKENHKEQKLVIHHGTDEQLQKYAKDIVENFNNRSEKNVFSKHLVEHITSGKVFSSNEAEPELIEQLQKAGKIHAFDTNSMLHDVIYFSKYTIHTGNDEANFPYSLKGIEEFKKSLLIRTIDALLEAVGNHADKSSTILPKFIQDDFGTKYYLPKNYQKVVRAKLLGLKHKVANSKKSNYEFVLKKLMMIVSLVDSKNNGNIYWLESEYLKYKDWTGRAFPRKYLRRFMSYDFWVCQYEILEESDDEIMNNTIDDFVTALIRYCYTTYVIYTDVVNNSYNLVKAKKELMNLLKEKLSNHFVGVRDKYQQLIREQEVDCLCQSKLDEL